MRVKETPAGGGPGPGSRDVTGPGPEMPGRPSSTIAPSPRVPTTAPSWEPIARMILSRLTRAQTPVKLTGQLPGQLKFAMLKLVAIVTGWRGDGASLDDRQALAVPGRGGNRSGSPPARVAGGQHRRNPGSSPLRATILSGEGRASRAQPLVATGDAEIWVRFAEGLASLRKRGPAWAGWASPLRSSRGGGRRPAGLNLASEKEMLRFGFASQPSRGGWPGGAPPGSTGLRLGRAARSLAMSESSHPGMMLPVNRVRVYSSSSSITTDAIAPAKG